MINNIKKEKNRKKKYRDIIKDIIINNKNIIIISLIILALFTLLLSNTKYMNKSLDSLIYFKNHKSPVLIFILISYILTVILHQQGIINIITGYIYGVNPGYYIALIISFFSHITSYIISKNIHNNKKNIDNLSRFKKQLYVFLSKFISGHTSSLYWGSTNIKFIDFAIPTILNLIIVVYIEIYIGSLIANIHNLKKYVSNSTKLLKKYKNIIYISVLLLIIFIILLNKYQRDEQEKIEDI